MRSCEEFADDVTLFIEGHLPLPTRASMLLHLAICSGCRAYLRQMRTIKKAAPDLRPDASEGPSDEALDELADLFNSENH